MPSELPLHSAITKKYNYGDGGWKYFRKKILEKNIAVKENYFQNEMRPSKTLPVALYFCGLWIVTQV